MFERPRGGERAVLVGVGIGHPVDPNDTAEFSALAASAGTLPTHGMQFIGLLVGTVVIVGGLTFFPALALGPVAEHFAMQAGSTF